jgi:hypothetical protein
LALQDAGRAALGIDDRKELDGRIIANTPDDTITTVAERDWSLSAHKLLN